MRRLYSAPDRLRRRARSHVPATGDLRQEVNKEIADFGCKVVAQYGVLGLYDFVSIIEAPDNETVTHLSIDLGSRGTVNIMTLPAIPTAQLREKLKGPKQMGRS